MNKIEDIDFYIGILLIVGAINNNCWQYSVAIGLATFFVTVFIAKKMYGIKDEKDQKTVIIDVRKDNENE